MTDKIIAIAAMLDATDGEQDNASRILQRMLASRNSTLTEFISAGLEKIGVTHGLKTEILADAIFPFDAERIDRLTAKLKANGLNWRAVATGTTSTNTAEEDARVAPYFDADPYDATFPPEGRKKISIPAEKKLLFEWKREELPDNIIALINPRERNGNELKVSAYTQDSETVIAFGDFIIKGQEEIESVLESVGQDRAMMFKVIAPKNMKKPMILELL